MTLKGDDGGLVDHERTPRYPWLRGVRRRQKWLHRPGPTAGRRPRSRPSRSPPYEPEATTVSHDDAVSRPGWRAYAQQPLPVISHASLLLPNINSPGTGGSQQCLGVTPRTGALARGPQGSPYGAALAQFLRRTERTQPPQAPDLQKRVEDWHPRMLILAPWDANMSIHRCLYRHPRVLIHSVYGHVVDGHRRNPRVLSTTAGDIMRAGCLGASLNEPRGSFDDHWRHVVRGM
jgi:hypothetical protein